MRKEQWRNTTAVYTYKPTDLCAVTPTERRKKEPTWRQLTPKCLWHHSTNPKLTGNKFREQAAGSEAFEGFLFSGKTFTTKRKEGSDWTRELQVHRGNGNSPMQSFQRCVLQCCQARRSWRPRWWCCGSGRRLWSPRWRPSESWSEPAGSSPPWALRGRHRWKRVSDRVTEGGASECMSGGWFESSAVSRAAGFKSEALSCHAWRSLYTQTKRSRCDTQAFCTTGSPRVLLSPHCSHCPDGWLLFRRTRLEANGPVCGLPLHAPSSKHKPREWFRCRLSPATHPDQLSSPPFMWENSLRLKRTQIHLTESWLSCSFSSLSVPVLW